MFRIVTCASIFLHSTVAYSYKVRRTSVRHDNGTLDAIPQRVLNGPARETLIALAYQGYVYPIRWLGDCPNDFLVNVEAIARGSPGHNVKVHLDDWIENYAAYYMECTATST